MTPMSSHRTSDVKLASTGLFRQPLVSLDLKNGYVAANLCWNYELSWE
jgi:hypothetical protein